jgi:hypothetical protein
VCVPQSDGSRVCDNDLSGIQNTENNPPQDAGAREGGRNRDAAADAIVYDAPPPQDTGVKPDTAPPVDSGTQDVATD